MTDALSVRASVRGDAVAVTALLSNAGLPTLDLDTAPGLRFWVADDGRSIAGAIGLESYGPTGLLRSLAVAPAHRNRGIATALVEALEMCARADGTRRLVLLTQTAQPFFVRLGYRVIERDDAPEEVKRSAEFASLCPDSAVCMTKSLAVESQQVLSE
jgi:amino-acid N-acetyltransferase